MLLRPRRQALLLPWCSCGRLSNRNSTLAHTRTKPAVWRVPRPAQEKRAGTFCCGGCGQPLFASSTKYESGERMRMDACILIWVVGLSGVLAFQPIRIDGRRGGLSSPHVMGAADGCICGAVGRTTAWGAQHAEHMSRAACAAGPCPPMSELPALLQHDRRPGCSWNQGAAAGR